MKYIQMEKKEEIEKACYLLLLYSLFDWKFLQISFLV